MAHSINLHGLGNGFLFLFYLIMAMSFFRYSSKTNVFRHPFILSVVGIFIFFSFIFLVNALASPPWQNQLLELIWLFLSALPAAMFFLMGHQWLMSEEKAKDSAERFNQMKDEFLTVASHELRTPLSVINGFAEILVREKLGALNDEQKRRVRKILMQGQRLHRIIDDLLDLSRIRSGKIEVKSEIFALVPVLKAVLDDHEVLCDQQRIKLADQIPDELPDVVGDLERVTQIVVNLMNNAIKYTEQGGLVQMTAVYDVNQKHVRVEVKDTGIGIDPKDQVHVFEEFFRANQQGAKKFSGSGLGLAIVKQLVEAQGGRVGVESEGVGKGSRFFFTLPTVSVAKSALKMNSAIKS